MTITVSDLKGIIPIVATTFDPRGNVDTDSFRQMLRHLLSTGVHGLTMFGLASEFYKLTETEADQLMKIFLEETSKYKEKAGIVSITAHSVEVAVRSAKKAEEYGADALMVLPPFFLHPSREAIGNHIEQVAKAVRVPLVIQYAPNQTGIQLEPEFFVRLQTKFANVKYVKVETQPPGKYISQLIDQSKGSIGSLVGYAGVQMDDALKRGANGVQPGCSFSEVYVELYRLYQSGDNGFDELFKRLLPYLSYWMQGIELIIKAEKTILYRRGIIASDYCRQPSYVFDRVEEAKINEFLDKFNHLL